MTVFRPRRRRADAAFRSWLLAGCASAPATAPRGPSNSTSSPSTISTATWSRASTPTRRPAATRSDHPGRRHRRAEGRAGRLPQGRQGPAVRRRRRPGRRQPGDVLDVRRRAEHRGDEPHGPGRQLARQPRVRPGQQGAAAPAARRLRFAASGQGLPAIRGFRGAGFTYLAANVVDAQTGKTLVPGWRIVDVKGVKVGLVGAVLKDTPSVAVASAIRPVLPRRSRRHQPPRCRAMRGRRPGVRGPDPRRRPYRRAFDKTYCDGLEGPIVGIVKKLDPAIRLVITGHSHKGYLCKVDGRVVTQADAAGHLLSRIKMTVDPVSGASTTSRCATW
jgi:hypothetical protein